MRFLGVRYVVVLKVRTPYVLLRSTILYSKLFVCCATMLVSASSLERYAAVVLRRRVRGM